MVTIAVIEDDKQMRELLRKGLSLAGFDVVEADDGSCVERLVAEASPDVALVDLVMPHVEGIETIRVLRAACPKLPIIAMSGCVFGKSDTLLRMAEGLGASVALAKPFAIVELISAIEAVLPDTVGGRDHGRSRNALAQIGCNE